MKQDQNHETFAARHHRVSTIILLLADNNLGAEQADLRHYPEAIAAFEQAIETDPSFAAARFNPGVAYLRMKRRAAALEQYKLLQDLDRELADKLYAGIYQGKILSAAGK